MPITKRALLISNPGEIGAKNYCKGVYVDVENYKRLLKSAEGGGWDDKEIHWLDRPTAKIARFWVGIHSLSDYSLIVFTGHGCYSQKHHDQILELREGENIASVDLHQGAKKRTIILDCCQEVHEEPVTEKVARVLNFSQAKMLRTANHDVCKKMFADEIQRSPAGIVKLTSCTKGELSTDSDTRGGRYNGSVMECVEDWVLMQQGISQKGTAVLSVVDAHECASARTKRLSDGLQNPTIEKPRTPPYFPLAVFG